MDLVSLARPKRALPVERRLASAEVLKNLSKSLDLSLLFSQKTFRLEAF
jgi:hypothetical protein